MSQSLDNRAKSRAECNDDEVLRLVGLARQQDSAAFSRLVLLYWDQVFGMVFHRTFAAMDAEDITQEVFIKAQVKLGGLKDPEKFKSWLFTIALNMVRDFKRKKKLMGFLGLTGQASTDLNTKQDFRSESALDKAMKKQFWARVESFTDKLPKLEKQVFLLRFLDQLTLDEIASVLDKSPSTVKTHLYRAVAKFRKNSELRGILREIPL